MMENRQKYGNLPVYLIVILSLLILSVWVSYFLFIKPNASISASYLEIFQEVEEGSVTNLNVECVDHKVVVLPSGDDKIKISYFQKPDNSITYTLEKGTVSLKMVERTENLDNLFYQSKRKLDTITIYVPESKNLNVRINSVDGSFTASDVTVRSLTFSSVNGPCDVRYITADRLVLSSNYGRIAVDSCTVKDTSLSQVTGTTSVKLLDSLNEYKVNVVSDYGTLYINGDRMHQKTEEADIIVNYYVQDSSSSRKLQVSGIRNTIEISSVEQETEEKK